MNAATRCSQASSRRNDRYGLAWLDLSAGRFSVMELEGVEALETEIERLRPAELLAAEGAPPLGGGRTVERPWRFRPPWHFDSDAAARALSEQFHTRDLAGFGCADKPLAVGAAGALLAYVRETQRAALPHLRSLTTEERDGALIMDPATRRNLELDESLAGMPELTLAGVFDRTVTAMGGRMLRRWLHRPLRDRRTLRERYQAVATLLEASRHTEVAECLRSIGDLERILARIALRSARPRDLAQLRAALGALPARPPITPRRAGADALSAPRAPLRGAGRSPCRAGVADACRCRFTAPLFARRRRYCGRLRCRSR